MGHRATVEDVAVLLGKTGDIAQDALLGELGDEDVGKLGQAGGIGGVDRLAELGKVPRSDHRFMDGDGRGRAAASEVERHLCHGSCLLVGWQLVPHPYAVILTGGGTVPGTGSAGRRCSGCR